MTVTVDEAISVCAVFNNGSIRPIWFSWRGRQLRIRETALAWKTREGDARVFHFSVTDGQGLYDITFHTGTFRWRILHAAG